MSDGLLFALAALLLVMIVISGYIVYLLRRGNLNSDDLPRQLEEVLPDEVEEGS